MLIEKMKGAVLIYDQHLITDMFSFNTADDVLDRDLQ